MEHLKDNESVEFVWRRLVEECPTWAIGVPILFALMVVGLIAFFRQEHKARAAIIGAIIVAVGAVIYLPLALILRPFASWLVVLIPVMAVALFYVVLMYLRDARSVNPAWALFLGFLRTCVYVTLAGVFLLPGCQYSDKSERESMVLVLFDVSGSMNHKDDLPQVGQDPNTILTRQDKVLQWLTANLDEKNQPKTPFIDRVLDKSPVIAYRFGSALDDIDVQKLRTGQTITAAEWKKWLVPNVSDIAAPDLDAVKVDDKTAIKTEEDKKKAINKLLDVFQRRTDMVKTLRTGTNIGLACEEAHKKENNTYLQAIVVISDGQNNLGSDDSRAKFFARLGAGKQQVPVFTIGVGKYQSPVSINVEEPQAPQESRPDDEFPVQVPVVGKGLRDETFTIELDVKRIKDRDGNPVKDEVGRKEHFTLPAEKGKFKGAGDNPQDVVKFKIDVQKLKNITAKQDEGKGNLEGTWEIRARVPRHAKENFAEAEHVTKPVLVQVQQRALRVLIFAGGATREYQFLRTMLGREMQEKRMEMCIYLQTGRELHLDQDVPPERLLADFPGKLEPNDISEKYMSLSDYDVIIAFDPDWRKLTGSQLDALNKWVGTRAGGIIFVAGPVYSWEVARAGGAKEIEKLQEIFPVVLRDNRTHFLNIDGSHDSTRPYALGFPNPDKFPFLKLDDDKDDPLAFWKGFFYDDENINLEAAKKMMPVRGFFSYYPVEELKPNSRVAATFLGPKESRINKGNDDQPFLVTMPFGTGQTLYVGSGEFWRLRQYKDGYHEKLWIKLMRSVAGKGGPQTKHGRILFARTAPVGLINFEVQLFKDQIEDADVRANLRKQSPTVVVKLLRRPGDQPVTGKEELIKFDLRAKPSDTAWEGYFTGAANIREPGEYQFQLRVPGTSKGILEQNLVITEPNLEKDNLAPNFGYLYQLASEAGPMLNRLPADTRKKIEQKLVMPDDQSYTFSSSKRLYFPLNSADGIADCLTKVPPHTQKSKGKFQYLVDEGAKTDYFVNVFWATLLAPLAVGLIGVIILGILRQWLAALGFFGICALVSVGMWVFNLVYSNLMSGELPVYFSFVLMIVVGFLTIEWLSRKLLRLA